ncbi:hypothetical protein HED55_10025 [Ochrobactrum haematophilum]|uniref:Uncharacterized protein n=1 Tax=Brucella haematophila TaxID=419474 RepID=A0ABX1DPN7_9HYPH|nr:hypothetical protein [Brucella haematophila]
MLNKDMEFLEDEKGDWAGISGFNFHFMTVTGAEKSTSIYNNKRNQAVISIQLAMTDSDGKPLNEDNSPTIDVVKNRYSCAIIIISNKLWGATRPQAQAPVHRVGIKVLVA